MIDSTETRGHASEIKFILDAQMAERIRTWARSRLEPDPHGAGPCGDEYQTTSLYFDTGDYDVFHRRGSFGRAKYRIRRYGDGDVVFLERKLRRPGLLVKRRTRAPIEALARLDQPGDFTAWTGDWFARRVSARRLSAVCQLSYARMARGIMTSAGLARLTLDESINATAISQVCFSSDAGASIVPGRLVLELKFRAHPPPIFKELVEEFGLYPQTGSKYRLGMAALLGFSLTDPSVPDAPEEGPAHV